MLRKRRPSVTAGIATAGTLAVAALGWTAVSSSSPARTEQLPAPAKVTEVAAPITVAEVAAPMSAVQAAAPSRAAKAPPAVSLVNNGAVVNVPVHPRELLHDAQTALRITRKILKQFPHVKLLSVSPRQGGGFNVKVLITPRQKGLIVVDNNLHIGALVPETPEAGAAKKP